MKRRDLLRTSTLGSALAFAHPRTALAAEATSPQAHPAPLPAFEFEELGIPALQNSLTLGEVTSLSMVARYLERIDQIDRNGPRINSVLEINPDARAIAESLDHERKEKGPRGPLHGIPILLKDNIDTADGMMTTAGSLALVGAQPVRDSFVAQRLREAGAVILGKTNLSEWANFRSNHSSSGWSGRGGQTRNPYVLDRNPSGSSSGSAAATAANLCAASVGTETNGSIVSPSSACSLVGLKPTLGLVSRSGIIPIAHSQDTAGPMARTVTDAAILLGALAGIDPRDPITRTSSGQAPTAYTQFLDRDGLRGARLGVSRKNFGFNDGVDRRMEEIIRVLKTLGAIVIDPVDLPTSGEFGNATMEVLLYEFKAGLNAYLGGLGPDAPVRSLGQLIEFNEANRRREMPYFGQELLVKAEAKGPLTEKKYLRALFKNHLLSRTLGIDLVMRKRRLEALIAPTGGPAWPTDWINGDHYSGGYSTMSAVAGYPHITVPAGHVFGLPFGISFFGKAFSEPKLIKFAYAFEQATKVRVAPRFLPSAGFEKS